MALGPPAVRSNYAQIARRYADKLSHRPLERALLGALPELAGLAATTGLVAVLGAGPALVARRP